MALRQHVPSPYETLICLPDDLFCFPNSRLLAEVTWAVSVQLLLLGMDAGSWDFLS